MTLCNMAVEMGGKTGIVEPDDKTVDYLRGRADGPLDLVRADPDAEYERILRLDVSSLEPQVACPHKVDNVKPVGEVEGKRVDQVFIGSCTNGRLEDLQAAMAVLRGRRVHKDVRLLVVPASREVYREALKSGIIGELIEAGAVVGNPSCGACFGGHIGLLAPGEVGLTTSNRNFKGRQGSPEAEVYLSSPAVAAASAVAGFIADPRELR
jgi:3-isopropylmalate/(R)-2-methylmalate dehydratase large subunit